MKRTFADQAKYLSMTLTGQELEEKLLELHQLQNSNKSTFVSGGTMLTEFNGGFKHEDPSSNNIHQGIPVGPEAVVEQGETKFSPQNSDMDDFIFSEREKAPNGKSFAQLSKSIKNKFKVRPHDMMAKEAMDKQLSQLAEAQEAQKAVKAEKLIAKAIELNPQLAQQMQQLLHHIHQLPFE